MRKYALFILSFLSLFFGFLPEGFCRLNISDGGGGGGGSGGPMVKVEGRQLKTDFDRDGNYEVYTVKGVGYSPYPIGRHVSDWGSNIFDDPNILNRDFALLQSMHANTIRLWKGNDTQDGARFQTKLTSQTLNLADQHGLKIIAGFWVDTPGPACGVTYVPPSFLDQSNPNYTNDRNAIINNFGTYVSNFKTHQAILFWAIGNENNLYIPSQYLVNWYSLVNVMAQKAHDVEGKMYHPVAVIEGDIGTIGQAIYGSTDALLPYVDIWGSNVYRGNSFGTLFSEFSTKTSKPLWISEYGIDSYFTTSYVLRSDHFEQGTAGYSDSATQASWDNALWDEIVSNKNIVVGGTVMEYSDEWWKPYEWIEGGIYNSTQEHFGFGKPDADCNGQIDNGPVPAFPDGFIDEEWAGFMQISKNPIIGGPDIMRPKDVYYSFQNRFSCGEAALYYAGIDNGKSCDGTDACCASAAGTARGNACVSSCKNIKKILQY